MTAVHVVVPEGIDDPASPSGGNTFDRRVIHGLRETGSTVHVHEVAGDPALATAVAAIPDGSVVLLDGLVASPAPDVLVPEADRLQLVVLVHMPLCDEREGAVLSAAQSVIATSHWARRMLLERYPLGPERIRVAEPGVDGAEPAAGTPNAGALLTVAAVIPGKGHDVLVEALADLRDVRWQCECVGSVDREPDFAADVRRRVRERGLDGRVRFPGPKVGDELARSYEAADLLVLPTRGETYGMVVTEALARGLPVVAADVGGVGEALGHGAEGVRPGMLVPPGDPAALREAVRAWLCDPRLRDRLRRAAGERRTTLTNWSTTTSVVGSVLAEAAR